MKKVEIEITEEETKEKFLIERVATSDKILILK